MPEHVLTPVHTPQAVQQTPGVTRVTALAGISSPRNIVPRNGIGIGNDVLPSMFTLQRICPSDAGNRVHDQTTAGVTTV